MPNVIDVEATLVARVERMLDLAPHLGVNPESLAFLAHRLDANGRQREGMAPSARRDELDERIRGDLEALCRAYKRMASVVDGMATA